MRSLLALFAWTLKAIASLPHLSVCQFKSSRSSSKAYCGSAGSSTCTKAPPLAHTKRSSEIEEQDTPHRIVLALDGSECEDTRDAEPAAGSATRRQQHGDNAQVEGASACARHQVVHALELFTTRSKRHCLNAQEVEVLNKMSDSEASEPQTPTIEITALMKSNKQLGRSGSCLARPQSSL